VHYASAYQNSFAGVPEKTNYTITDMDSPEFKKQLKELLDPPYIAHESARLAEGPSAKF